MNYIECKAQWFSRPLKTTTGISGFEGPAAKAMVDDGFGSPTIKGGLTPSYQAFFEVTGRDSEGAPLHDGTVNIPDTPVNRYKIAVHIRSGDFRVKDRVLERQILAECRPLSREEAPKPRSFMQDMPADFDGSKVRLKRDNSGAIVDPDPIEDPFAGATDAEFTEVKKSEETKALAPPETDAGSDAQAPRRTSPEEVRAGAISQPVTAIRRGRPPKSSYEPQAPEQPETAQPKEGV